MSNEITDLDKSIVKLEKANAKWPDANRLAKINKLKSKRDQLKNQ